MNNIFYNELIYESYQDYVLGGFHVPEDANIDYNVISNAVNERLKILIENYIIRAYSASIIRDEDFAKEEIMMNLGFMVKDNLGFLPMGLSSDILQRDIMNSEQMMTWLEGTIKERVKTLSKNQESLIDVNNTSQIFSKSKIAEVDNPILFLEAQEATSECTLEEFFEQLSLIEL